MGDLNVTLHHDGVFVPNPLKLVLSNAKHIYYCLPDTTLTRGIRELKTDSDMAEFMRIGYENNKHMELFTEHHGYDVLEYTANDNLVANNISDYEESDVSDYDGESDPENVDFHTEGEHGVHFERLSIDDAFLTKLVGNGNFIGARSDPMPFLIGNYNVEEDDPEVDILDPIYKKKLRKTKKRIRKKVKEYRNVVIESNPGLTCHIDQVVDDDRQIHFSRLYVCYKGLKDGWIAGCRRVIGIDGCFLTHYCKGELLSVIGRDANNQMFPIAWAVVRVENKNNWCWFLSLLSDDLGLQDGLGITVISDAHKGLEEAVKTWLPQAEHRHCTRHIYANFKKKWSGVHYKRMFWAAASSTVEQEFLSKMEDIRRFDPEAHAYLMKREPASWCKAFFQPAVKCVAFENGISESFNGKIVTARGKPIITMLEDIRVYVMQRHWTISKKASELEDTICPSIRKKNEILKKKMRSWQMWKASPNTPPLPPIIQKMSGRPRKKRVRHPTENDYE
ncbi:hypothetical protein Tco_0912537, partial [Tanacetum coccineum]